MKQYKYYLFDWDGCLGRTLDVWMDAYADVYSKYGVTDTSLKTIIKTSWGNLEEGPKNNGIKEYQKAWDEIVDLVAANTKHVKLYENALLTLETIKNNGGKISIVTSSEHEAVDEALENTGVAQYIESVIAADDVENPKPDPEMLQKALDSINGTKESTVIVGDTAKDVFSGHYFEIDSVLVLHDGNKHYYDFEKMKQSNPTYIVTSLLQIII